MRAKLIIVVLVVFGLLGGVVITASAADRAQVAGDNVMLTTAGDTTSVGQVPAMRDGNGDDNGGDVDQGGGGDPNCPANDGVLIVVCAEVEDVLSDILAT